jgi:hypothetical protein
MTSTRVSTLLLVPYFVLSGVSCSDGGTASGSPTDETTGGSGGAVGGSSAYQATGGMVGASGASSGAGGDTVSGTTGGVSAGGSQATGGAWTNGGNTAAGGTSSSGGNTAPGGGRSSGGNNVVGGTSSSGGNTAVGGAQSSGGTSTTGGRSFGGRGGQSSGGTSANAGATSGGGASSSGGSTSAGGNTSATGGSSGSTDCTFDVTPSTSSKIATVGIVQWSTSLSNVSSAKIVYTLDNAGADILNKGGTAPVDVTQANHRTLLLGLKPSSKYTFHVEATGANGTCTSPDYSLTTGALSGAPSVTRTVSNASASAKGFIVTSTGQGGGGMGGGSGSAYIIDADGTVVWYAAAPSQCSRALMDWEGANMWMLSLNVQNGGGEMRYVSMDGETGQNNVSGLSSAHHDFTVVPGGIVAAMVWASSGNDPESNLIERSPDGTLTTKFKIGSNLYLGGQSAMGGGSGTFHCNSIHYHQADDSYSIADRNPNLMVKATRTGSPVWQIGGNCSGAPAPKCASGDWQVNHGHDFDKNGNLLFFNNGQGGGMGGGGSSHVFELKITDSGTFSTSVVKDFTSGNSSNVLGDVQRLPNGNTLITYSTAGVMLEVDASWATIQTLKGSLGYSNWRETLYGPPSRI